MKKIAFTLVLAFVCLVAAAQQPYRTSLGKAESGLCIEQMSKSMQNQLNYTQRFDSIVDNYDSGKTVIKYSYDDHAHLSMRIEEIFEGNVMIYSQKNTYVYDENNNCVLKAEYDWYNEQWEEKDRFEYIFDGNGNCLSQTRYSWGTPESRVFWTFDSENHCLSEECDYYNNNSTVWRASYRIENIYDTQGNLIFLLRKKGDIDGTLVDSYKEEYEYDINRNMILKVHSEWQSHSQEWKEKEKLIYSYDANNNLICQTKYSGFFIYKSEYTFDERNRLVLILSTKLVSVDWENDYKTEYEYDGNDSLVLETHYDGNGPQWINESKREYLRNEAGYVTCKTVSYYLLSKGWIAEYQYLYDYNNYYQLVSVTYLSSDSSNELVCIFKHVREFDVIGNMAKLGIYFYNNGEWEPEICYENAFDMNDDASNILGISMIYNEIFNESLFLDGNPFYDNPVRNKWLSCRWNKKDGNEGLCTVYYSDYYDVNEIELTSLKVYSSEGTLSVENDAVADIQVFDMLGRLVAQQNQVTQCRFNLKPGVYVVKSNDASMKTVVK